jgi:hypothetical protein
VRRTLEFLALLLTAFPQARALASGGVDFRVNTYTTLSQSAPSIASDASGRFVVVWHSPNQDGDSLGVFAQRFEADGSAAGGEMQVNTYTTSSQSTPAVARDGAGRFLVVWQSLQPEDGSSTGVFARLFDAAGSAQTAEFRVNTYTTMQQQNPAAAATSAGFVVVWSSYGEDGSSHGIFGQRYDSAGSGVGGEFRVNTYTTFAQLFPAVAATADGSGFVVAWESFRDGSQNGIYARRFSASGAPLGDEFRVNITTTFQQHAPRLAADGKGSFLVAWHGNQDGGYDVFGQRLTSSGAPLGGEFRVNTYTTSDQKYPSVAGLSGGGFVVAWQGPGDGNQNGILAQRFSAAGAPEGGETVVNAFTTNSQSGVALAPGLGDGYVAVWSSVNQDGSSDGVFGRQFVFDPPTDSGDLRVNTYTTLGQFQESVALGPSGFVVVWTSLNQDGNGNGIFGQCFGPGGAAVGEEFRVNTYTTGTQKDGRVAVLANGEFVVAWMSVGGGQSEIQAQRYAATGAPLGGEFRVNTVTTSSQAYPDVAATADGFVVAWNSSGGGISTDVQAQRFSADGAPLGGEFRVNTYTTHAQGYASIAARPSGEFVVVWHSSGQVSGYDVFGQRYDASGAPLGEEFPVNVYTTGNQLLPKTAMDAAGNFVVVWGSSTGTGYDVLAQRFAASGQPLGTEVRVNHDPTGITSHVIDQSIADVAASDRGFTVVWNSPAIAHQGVFGQRFGTGGERFGPEFRVNASTSSSEMRSIAADANGSFVVAYQLASGASATDVYRRRFSALLPGDVDGNGVVNVADVFYLINFLFAGGPTPIGVADVDGSGGVDVLDVFYLINFLFAGGPAPA